MNMLPIDLDSMKNQLTLHVDMEKYTLFLSVLIKIEFLLYGIHRHHFHLSPLPG